MNRWKAAGLVLLVLGVLGLVLGSFTYTKERHEAEIGPLEISVEDTERVNIPQWASIAAVVAGAGLLVFGGRGTR
jgi:drug/metabolite transporter (DMT)-like permease